MVKLEDLPLIASLEEIAYTELDRQFSSGALEPGIAYETSYFDPISGEIQGIPDFSKVILAVLEALRERGLMA